MTSTERRAKELAKALEVAESGSDLELQILAAALAACARERDRSNREYYKDVLNKAGEGQATWVIHEAPILSEAERAVGEKGKRA